MLVACFVCQTCQNMVYVKGYEVWKGTPTVSNESTGGGGDYSLGLQCAGHR